MSKPHKIILQLSSEELANLLTALMTTILRLEASPKGVERKITKLRNISYRVIEQTGNIDEIKKLI